MNKEIQEALREVVWKSIKGLYQCDRVWSAWSYGTMTEEDFSPAEDDEDLVNEMGDGILKITDKSREAEIKRLREALKGTIYYLRNGELDARRRGTCMMDILETADEILKDGNQ